MIIRILDFMFYVLGIVLGGFIGEFYRLYLRKIDNSYV